MTEDELRVRVSYHAVTRYCQRILDVTVPWAVDPLSPKEIAEAHCLTAEMSIEAVRALIMVPAVQSASLAGITHVRVEDFVAKLGKNGIVVTIQEPPAKRTKPFKLMSRNERRRKQHAHSRRIRHKPLPPQAGDE